MNLLPGVGAGQFGRKVKTLAEVNSLNAQFNDQYAGTLTAHGQALVRAGLFTETQLKRLGAVAYPIPAIPLTNRSPWNNVLAVNLGVERPVRIAERFVVDPFATINNFFNHAPCAPNYGLNGTFGTLNFDYAAAPAGYQISDLTRARGRLNSTRFIQVGVRVDF